MSKASFVADSTPDFIWPHGHIVDIEIEKDKVSNQQIGPIIQHLIIDAGYLDNFMKVRTTRNIETPRGPREVWSKADDSALITFLEKKLQSCNLFGENQKYYSVTHNSEKVDPQKAPNSIVLYAQSSLPHKAGCPNEQHRDQFNRVLIEQDDEGKCKACEQRRRHDALRFKGWIVHAPPLKESRNSPFTPDRVEALREAMISMMIPEETMHAAEKAIAESDILFFSNFLRNLEDKQFYANKAMADVFEKMGNELIRRHQKGVDTRIGGYLDTVSQYAMWRGGRHAIALVAGDFDFQNNVWRCIANSAFSESSENKHSALPRARIAVFNFGEGTSDGLMTGRYLPTYKNNVPQNEWYFELMRRGLRNYEFTQQDIMDISYEPKRGGSGQDERFFNAQRRGVNS